MASLVAVLVASLLFAGSLVGGANARSGVLASVPRWASHGFIVFKYHDFLCVLRPGSESGGVLLSAPHHTPWPQWDPALSANGRFLAFRGYYQPFAEGDYALYVLNLRTSKWRRVTGKGSVASDPSWSPDGRWIAFDASGQGEIWKVRASGGKPVRLTRRPGRVSDAQPAWSPKGRLIAFVRTDRRGQIWVMRPNGRGARLLHTDSRVSDYEPTWSRDGKQIAFVALGRSRARIKVMNADGSHVRELPSPLAAAWNPVWLPQDTGIAFLANSTADLGGGNLFVMRPNGSHLQQLTHWHRSARTEQFTWSGAHYQYGRG
jgi:Tol biopolymer transport system component